VRVHVGVPWRGGDPWRERSFRYVCDHLHALGLVALPADSDHEPFSRAGSRNRAVRQASKADVVILHDADMVAPDYEEMAELALETGQMVVGFSDYRPLDRATTEQVIAGAEPFSATPVSVLTNFSVGGIIAITPDAWWAAGGMDERYVDWGCEDFAFANAAGAALGPVLRVKQPAVHLWHEHAADTNNPDQRNNSLLLAKEV
jgi:GT2 family glycosyltransferase